MSKSVRLLLLKLLFVNIQLISMVVLFPRVNLRLSSSWILRRIVGNIGIFILTMGVFRGGVKGYLLGWSIKWRCGRMLFSFLWFLRLKEIFLTNIKFRIFGEGRWGYRTWINYKLGTKRRLMSTKVPHLVSLSWNPRFN